jgi:hypothetical protein
VQLLQLEGAPLARELEHEGQAVGVVGGELRPEQIAAVEEPAGAGEVADVGRDLAGPDRVVLEALLLGAFDFGVPIGTFDEPDGDPPVGTPGELREPIEDRQGALLVGLDGEAEAAPAGERVVPGEAFHDVELGLEPVGLLGVDRQRYGEGAGPGRELDERG